MAKTRAVDDQHKRLKKKLTTSPKVTLRDKISTAIRRRKG